MASFHGVALFRGVAPFRREASFREGVSFREEASFREGASWEASWGAPVGKALDSQHSRTHQHLFARTASEGGHVRLDQKNTNQQKQGGSDHAS